MRVSGIAFTGAAASRLLPASIPFRFFGAAAAYHLLAWIALLVGARGVPRFAGGLGWPLAALHLATLGVLVMTAIGASLQLLPVATRRPVASHRWPAAIWWLYTPGVAVVALGMGMPEPNLLAIGALAVSLALVGYAVLLALNLLGASGMPVVVAHGYAALAALIVALVTAISLVCAYLGAPLFGRSTALALHTTFAAYGFMGMLALGLSYVLVPMFALAAAPDYSRARLSLMLAVTALLLAAVAATGVVPQALRIAAVGTGAGAVALHWRLMNFALKTGMRRNLGRSATLMKIGWTCLAASLAAGLGVAVDVPFDGMAALFGLLLVAGWLLTFLLGVLQRIVPFLASMHRAPGKRLPPTPSSLTAQRPLAIHFTCHLAALALLAVAIVADNPWFAAAGALAGGAGAVAFGSFLATVLRRMSSPDVKAGARETSVG
jgi:hypothetical protein